MCESALVDSVERIYHVPAQGPGATPCPGHAALLSAGGGTRTPTGFRPPAPKAGADTSFATPARLHCAAFRTGHGGNDGNMSTPEERERESQAADKDKFTENEEREREERSEIAERLREEELTEGDGKKSSS